MVEKNQFSCGICGGSNHSIIYNGPIRDGSFGSSVDKSNLYHCNNCGVVRLDEKECFKQVNYETTKYREEMGQGLSVEDFYKNADPIQIHHLEAFWPFTFRNKVVADVGCGAGSFIDHISGVTSNIIAIEPTQMYHKSLSDRGYKVFSYANTVGSEFINEVDIIVSFQVIEHVEDPINFLRDLYKLLKKGGKIIIATPNHNDILLKLIPEEFNSFYYRRVHRWYFDEKSLSYSLERSGFKNLSVRYLHSFGLSNAMFWLKDKKPTGNIKMNGIDKTADTLWKAYTESTKQSDTIFIMAEK